MAPTESASSPAPEISAAGARSPTPEAEVTTKAKTPSKKPASKAATKPTSKRAATKPRSKADTTVTKAKSETKKPSAKKASTSKVEVTHPSWKDMIKVSERVLHDDDNVY
jgi:hypothetical protein